MSGDVLMLSVSGCRGVVGSTLTPEVAARFAATLGTFVRDQPGRKRGQRPLVVVGRDGRSGGQMVRDAAVSGLCAAGCDVLDAGIAMTPTCGVGVDTFKAEAAIVLTASHNPQQWNGLKIILRDAQNKGLLGSSACAPGKSVADQVIERFKTIAPAYVTWNDIGTVEDASIETLAAHVSRAMSAIEKLGAKKKLSKRRFKVALDCVNGSGQWAAPDWLKSLGCKVSAEGIDPSGLFSHTPEPTAENLTGLCKLAKKSKADIGFAQDPDADRLAIIDERGRYIGEEYTLVLATMALGRLGGLRKGQTLCVNLSTSRMIDDVAASFGCRVQRTSVGEANVVEAMKRLKSPIGGEGNGGVIWPGVTYIRDSIGAMGLVLSLMAHTGLRVSELVSSVPAYAIVKRKVELADRSLAVAAAEKIAQAYAGETVDRQDGVRVDFASKRAWLHVRASNTEPIMRLIAEAPTAAISGEILDEAARVIG